jgi:GTP-binding protein
MSLVCRFRSITTITGRRYDLYLPKLAQQSKFLTFSSVSTDLTSPSSSSTILRQKITPTKIRTGTTNEVGFHRFSSSSKKNSKNYDDSNHEAAGVISVRSRFKEIPVHPSILQYIQRVGIGREGKENRRKRNPFGKKKKGKNNKRGGYDEQHRNVDSNTMSREEERVFFGNGRMARRSGAVNSATKGGGRPQQRPKQSIVPLSPPPPAPPPPFGEGQQARRAITIDHDKDDDNGNIDSSTTTKQKLQNIRILPVKVLGRVTSPHSSPNDDSEIKSHIFPRPTSGLPEVAIIGRSNVGKSTLLNALLYSGRSIEKEDSEDLIRRRNKRFRSRVVTSQTAKLPKGVKAKISSKPGETRSIDFYQLSAEIEELGSNEDDQKENIKRSSSNNNNNKPSEEITKRRKKKSSLLLVDLPGYGFAFGPKKERRQSQADGNHTNDEESEIDFLFPWQSLIETYITDRPRSSLKRVLLLVDARHGMKQADSHFLASLQRALQHRQRSAATAKTSSEQHQQPRVRVPTELPPLQIVLTKCDLVSQVDLARRVVQVRQQLSDCLVRQPKMLPEMLVSAQIDGQGGLLELQKELASLCGGGSNTDDR